MASASASSPGPCFTSPPATTVSRTGCSTYSPRSSCCVSSIWEQVDLSRRSATLLKSLFIWITAATCAWAADSYRVINAYPHDQQAFTQGLIYADGHLYESTGISGRSSLRMEELETGRILQFHDVPNKYFAEGLTDWANTLVQLTWETHVAFVYDRSTFRLLNTFHYDG